MQNPENLNNHKYLRGKYGISDPNNGKYGRS